MQSLSASVVAVGTNATPPKSRPATTTPNAFPDGVPASWMFSS
jgi:hypothetical protein